MNGAFLLFLGVAHAEALPTVVVAIDVPARCPDGKVPCVYDAVFHDPATASPAAAERSTRALLGLTDEMAWGIADPTSRLGTILVKGYKSDELPPSSSLWTSVATSDPASVRTAPGPAVLPAPFAPPPPLPGAPAPAPPVAPAWIGPSGSDALFQSLRWSVGSGSSQWSTGVDAPPTVALRGRFATRLSADGVPVPFELLASDGTRGAAFYEQLYPVSKAALATTFAPAPRLALGQVRDPKVDPTDCAAGTPGSAWLLHATGTDRCAARIAGSLARGFFDLAERSTLHFGLPTATAVQTRVLTAVTAMRAPPATISDLPPMDLAQLNVAGTGQLDPDAMKADPPRPMGTSGRLDLRYSALPARVARDAVNTLDRLPVTKERPVSALDSVNGVLAALFTDDLRPGVTAPSLDPDAAWFEASATAGRQDVLQAEFTWRVLEHLVTTWLPPAERPFQAEALLQASLRYDVFGLLNPAGVAPAAVEKAALGVWLDTFAAHGITALAGPQTAPGTVDPLAVCTVGDGEGARKEPVLREVTVDLLFALPGAPLPAPTGEETPEERARLEAALQALVWEARAELPFVMLDDPTLVAPLSPAEPGGTPPSRVEVLLERDHVTIYRARWRVWSGWHLLWNLGAPDDDGAAPLRLRFAAICTDTVLAPQALVPALVEEALAFRATESPAGEPRDERLELRPYEANRVWLGAIVEAPLRALADEGAATLVLSTTTRERETAKGGPGLAFDEPGLRTDGRADDAGAKRWVSTHAQALLLPGDPVAPRALLAPDKYAQLKVLPIRDADTITDLKAPQLLRWPRRHPTRVVMTVGAGIFAPWSALDTTEAVSTVAGAEMTLHTRTLLFGPGISLDVAGGARLVPFGTEVEGYIEGGTGLWFAPLPASRVGRNGTAWGTTTPSGQRQVGRFQGGAMVGTTVSTAGGGTGVWLEPAVAWSIHASKGRRGTLNPYDPHLLVGPWLRVGLDVATADFVLVDQLTVGGGVRVWLDPTNLTAPKTPKEPTLE